VAAQPWLKLGGCVTAECILGPTDAKRQEAAPPLELNATTWALALCCPLKWQSAANGKVGGWTPAQGSP
jgi:hypothetical protein